MWRSLRTAWRPCRPQVLIKSEKVAKFSQKVKWKLEAEAELTWRFDWLVAADWGRPASVLPNEDTVTTAVVIFQDNLKHFQDSPPHLPKDFQDVQDAWEPQRARFPTDFGPSEKGLTDDAWVKRPELSWYIRLNDGWRHTFEEDFFFHQLRVENWETAPCVRLSTSVRALLKCWTKPEEEEEEALKKMSTIKDHALVERSGGKKTKQKKKHKCAVNGYSA